ncbi:MAG: type IV secretion system DNA-binding domain-containing protein [Nocardioides sp.]|uniref:type IV secretory system conjugative DNA transfer family protein n=1 Tax=Nocardioides sp. TaxID=35761 RepID=UPI0039E462F5
MSTVESDSELWTLWTLGPSTPDTHRLAASLLAQEAPVCVRMSVTPTDLTDVERDGLEALVERHKSDVKESASRKAAHRTLESILYLRPLFQSRCVVASPEPLAPALLSTIGHTLSEPAEHVSEPPPALAGGYAIERGSDSLGVFEGGAAKGELPSKAPAGLGRLRSLLGVWEAANLFRLPVVTDEDYQALPIDDSPLLPGVLAHLPVEGTRIGSISRLPQRSVAIASEDRFRHAYVVGQTGTGKSTLLMNMALDDIAAGDGVCVIDPHGDLVEGILSRIPPERAGDVVLVDPADPVAVVGVNLIEAESDLQKNYLTTEVGNMLQKLFDPNNTGIVGPRWHSMMRQAILLLQSSAEIKSSLLDASTVFSDVAVRKFLVDRAQDDPMVMQYWLSEVPQASRSNEWGEVVAWFNSKFEVFRASRLLRGVIGQSESSVSFSDIIRDRRILLVNLSKGAMGSSNAELLGHVVVMKLWGTILERTRIPHSQRTPFYVYIDEFQNITTDSLDTMLAEARKYGVGLTLANQFFDQLNESTRAALLGNVGTKLAFRLGPADAAAFCRWLGGDVEPDELTHLPNHQMVAALSPGGVPTSPVLLKTRAPSEPDFAAAEAVRERSRTAHAVAVDVAEERFTRRWAPVAGSFAAKALEARRKAEPSDPGTTETPGVGPTQGAPTSSFLDSWLAKRTDAPAARDQPHAGASDDAATDPLTGDAR